MGYILSLTCKTPPQHLESAAERGFASEPYGYTLATLRATGRPVHRNFGLVTETKPERTNGDFKSRPPRAWIVCYSHYQNSFDWTTSFLSDALIL